MKKWKDSICGQTSSDVNQYSFVLDQFLLDKNKATLKKKDIIDNSTIKKNKLILEDILVYCYSAKKDQHEKEDNGR
jgi:hypothetical protein